MCGATGVPRAASARSQLGQRGAEHREQRRAARSERLLERDAADVRDDHWKISVVQSPP
jgi:hypothetical protein